MTVIDASIVEKYLNESYEMGVIHSISIVRTAFRKGIINKQQLIDIIELFESFENKKQETEQSN